MVRAMPVTMDTGQGAGLSDAGDKDTYLQVLLQELCQLQAKYEFFHSPPCPCLIPAATSSGLSGWD